MLGFAARAQACVSGYTAVEKGIRKKNILLVILDEEMDALVDMVRNDRMLSKNNPSAQLEYIIPEMLEEIIKSRFYEPDYKNVTQKLLYEDIDYAID